jgi:predicted TIM-barrel fold metal-dependent hydrolase
MHCYPNSTSAAAGTITKSRRRHGRPIRRADKLGPASQVMFGSDYPFIPGIEAVEGLSDHGFSAVDQRAIERDNVLSCCRL